MYLKYSPNHSGSPILYGLAGLTWVPVLIAAEDSVSETTYVLRGEEALNRCCLLVLLRVTPRLRPSLEMQLPNVRERPMPQCAAHAGSVGDAARPTRPSRGFRTERNKSPLTAGPRKPGSHT